MPRYGTLCAPFICLLSKNEFPSLHNLTFRVSLSSIQRERQAEIGEKLVDSYAWATPDNRCLEVFKHFGPIVEVGCGSNAYWANWMARAGGVDVVALDLSLDSGGGKINKNRTSGQSRGGCQVLRGGPASLSENNLSSRTLFLCYPDEEDTLEDDGDDAEQPMSMAAQCLENFSGDTIIYVGELFGDTLR